MCNFQIKKPKEYFEEDTSFHNIMEYNIDELKKKRSSLKSIIKYDSKGLLMCDYSNLMKLVLVEKAIYRKKEHKSYQFHRLLDLPFRYLP